MLLDKIPAVQKAIAQAQAEVEARRDYVFADLPERIGRLDVAQLTIRHLLLLNAARSRFLCGGTPAPGDIAQFLWIIRHSSFVADRQSFLTRIARLKYLPTVRAIHRYLDRALFDCSSGGGSRTIPTASLVASFIHRFASAYGWRRDEILELKVAEAFQYLRLIDRDADPRAPVMHPLVDKARRLAIARWKKAHPKQWAARQAELAAKIAAAEEQKAESKKQKAPGSTLHAPSHGRR